MEQQLDNSDLPPGWSRTVSRSRPGTICYEHVNGRRLFRVPTAADDTFPKAGRKHDSEQQGRGRENPQDVGSVASPKEAISRSSKVSLDSKVSSAANVVQTPTRPSTESKSTPPSSSRGSRVAVIPQKSSASRTIPKDDDEFDFPGTGRKNESQSLHSSNKLKQDSKNLNRSALEAARPRGALENGHQSNSHSEPTVTRRPGGDDPSRSLSRESSLTSPPSLQERQNFVAKSERSPDRSHGDGKGRRNDRRSPPRRSAKERQRSRSPLASHRRSPSRVSNHSTDRPYERPANQSSMDKERNRDRHGLGDKSSKRKEGSSPVVVTGLVTRRPAETKVVTGNYVSGTSRLVLVPQEDIHARRKLDDPLNNQKNSSNTTQFTGAEVSDKIGQRSLGDSTVPSSSSDLHAPGSDHHQAQNMNSKNESGTLSISFDKSKDLTASSVAKFSSHASIEITGTAQIGSVTRVDDERGETFEGQPMGSKQIPTQAPSNTNLGLPDGRKDVSGSEEKPSQSIDSSRVNMVLEASKSRNEVVTKDDSKSGEKKTEGKEQDRVQHTLGENRLKLKARLGESNAVGSTIGAEPSFQSGLKHNSMLDDAKSSDHCKSILTRNDNGTMRESVAIASDEDTTHFSEKSTAGISDVPGALDTHGALGSNVLEQSKDGAKRKCNENEMLPGKSIFGQGDVASNIIPTLETKGSSPTNGNLATKPSGDSHHHAMTPVPKDSSQSELGKPQVSGLTSLKSEVNALPPGAHEVDASRVQSNESKSSSSIKDNSTIMSEAVAKSKSQGASSNNQFFLHNPTSATVGSRSIQDEVQTITRLTAAKGASCEPQPVDTKLIFDPSATEDKSNKSVQKPSTVSLMIESSNNNNNVSRQKPSAAVSSVVDSINNHNNNVSIQKPSTVSPMIERSNNLVDVKSFVPPKVKTISSESIIQAPKLETTSSTISGENNLVSATKNDLFQSASANATSASASTTPVPPLQSAVNVMTNGSKASGGTSSTFTLNLLSHSANPSLTSEGSSNFTSTNSSSSADNSSATKAKSDHNIEMSHSGRAGAMVTSSDVEQSSSIKKNPTTEEMQSMLKDENSNEKMASLPQRGAADMVASSASEKLPLKTSVSDHPRESTGSASTNTKPPLMTSLTRRPSPHPPTDKPPLVTSASTNNLQSSKFSSASPLGSDPAKDKRPPLMTSVSAKASLSPAPIVRSFSSNEKIQSSNIDSLVSLSPVFARQSNQVQQQQQSGGSIESRPGTVQEQDRKRARLVDSHTQEDSGSSESSVAASEKQISRPQDQDRHPSPAKPPSHPVVETKVSGTQHPTALATAAASASKNILQMDSAKASEVSMSQATASNTAAHGLEKVKDESVVVTNPPSICEWMERNLLTSTASRRPVSDNTEELRRLGSILGSSLAKNISTVCVENALTYDVVENLMDNYSVDLSGCFVPDFPSCAAQFFKRFGALYPAESTAWYISKTHAYYMTLAAEKKKESVEIKTEQRSSIVAVRISGLPEEHKLLNGVYARPTLPSQPGDSIRKETYIFKKGETDDAIVKTLLGRFALIHFVGRQWTLQRIDRANQLTCLATGDDAAINWVYATGMGEGALAWRRTSSIKLDFVQ